MLTPTVNKEQKRPKEIFRLSFGNILFNRAVLPRYRWVLLDELDGNILETVKQNYCEEIKQTIDPKTVLLQSRDRSLFFPSLAEAYNYGWFTKKEIKKIVNMFNEPINLDELDGNILESLPF